MELDDSFDKKWKIIDNLLIYHEDDYHYTEDIIIIDFEDLLNKKTMDGQI